jgi:lipid A 3-O-deacylase
MSRDACLGPLPKVDFIGRLGGCVIALRVWRSLFATPALVFGLVVWFGPASSADLSAPAPSAPANAPYSPFDSSSPFDPYSYELRFGTFAHGVGGAEHGTIDLNPEVVFPRLPFGESYWWNIFVPRPHLGGQINLDGRTSSVYAGALWTFPLPHRFFAELFLDGEAHNGYLVSPPPGHSGLGCPYLFHDGGSIGYHVSQHWSVMFTFDHQSNGHALFGTACDGLGPNTPNAGINDYGLRIGYSF